MTRTNKYKRRFTAKCPNNGKVIRYTLTIETDWHVVKVEDIVLATRDIGTEYHEVIADTLANRFGGLHTLVAHHHGVWIETVRGAR